MKAIQVTLFIIFLSFTSCAQKSNDKIVGVWNVKTDYYQAIYEIVESKKSSSEKYITTTIAKPNIKEKIRKKIIF